MLSTLVLWVMVSLSIFLMSVRFNKNGQEKRRIISFIVVSILVGSTSIITVHAVPQNISLLVYRLVFLLASIEICLGLLLRHGLQISQRKQIIIYILAPICIITTLALIVAVYR